MSATYEEDGGRYVVYTHLLDTVVLDMCQKSGCMTPNHTTVQSRHLGAVNMNVLELFNIHGHF